MSKINPEFLKRSITDMLAERKQYCDPEKRFTGAVKLPHFVHSSVRVCALANAAHIEECVTNQVPYIDVEVLKAFNKERQDQNQKLVQKIDLLLASGSVAKQVNKLLGNVLVKFNKFPLALAEGEIIVDKINEVKYNIKFQSKKAYCLGTTIDNVNQTEEQLKQNITTSINFLVSLMKKGWQNVGTLYIKTTMGKSIKIFS